jgi:hypothetical protein
VFSDHQVQRLHRGDAVPRVRPAGGQALDPPHAQGQGQHQEGAQRLQVIRDGRSRRESSSHQVSMHMNGQRARIFLNL